MQIKLLTIKLLIKLNTKKLLTKLMLITPSKTYKHRGVDNFSTPLVYFTHLPTHS
jgi:hypothetical protein